MVKKVGVLFRLQSYDQRRNYILLRKAVIQPHMSNIILDNSEITEHIYSMR